MSKKWTRRDFVKNGALFGTFAGPLSSGAAQAQLFRRHHHARRRPPAQPLDPALVPKFVNKLVNPLGDAPIPVVRPAPGTTEATLRLTIQKASQWLGLRQGAVPVPKTNVWGYALSGSSNVSVVNPGPGATYPGPTLEMQRGTKLTVTFINGLGGVTFPANVPVDTTLEWANPGGLGGLAPIPVVTHLHGSRVNTIPQDNGRSDGGPLGWATPGDAFKGSLFTKPYVFDNKQEAGALWYHDHALGITRTNVYMGLAGLYFLRDGNENALRNANVLPRYPYEVPLILQDRMFLTDGSLFYPSVADPADNYPPGPTHLPEFFGDTILVNGTAWPRLDVERRKYRLRLLNGSDSRFYTLSLQQGSGEKLPLWVIGNELGFLNKPVRASLGAEGDVLLIAPGERYDVIIDFSPLPFGAQVLLKNAANAPYPLGDELPAPGITDQLMMFALTKPRNPAVPEASVSGTTQLRGNAPDTPPLQPPNTAAAARVRKLFLYEGTDSLGRLQTMLGVMGADQGDGSTGTMVFSDPVSEKPVAGTSEVWEFHNTTEDAHPIHMHLVDFRILNRESITPDLTVKTNSDGSEGGFLNGVTLGNDARPPETWEEGKKDTVIVYPGEMARVLANFDRPGEFVYHCHILSHEDHEMMRRYTVVSAQS